MKKILLQRLTLENFKNHARLVLDLQGRSASIYGDNATGKTSVYDALTWLLFGKDSHGKADNKNIKPLGKDGEVLDHEAITSVEALLTADGTPIVLKRTLRENWTTKRGGSTASRDGNTSDYFVDGVPCKKFEYDRRIGELVDENVFRLLTGITYFAQDLEWTKRRGVLFDICGVLSEKEIMQTDARFAELAEDVGSLSVEDYKRKVTAERKGYLDVKKDTPARLSEQGATEAELSGIDFAALRVKQGELEVQKDRLLEELYALRQDSALATKDKELYQIKAQCSELEAKNTAFRAEQQRSLPNVSVLHAEVGRAQRELQRCESEISSVRARIKAFESDLNAARERWIKVNEDHFVGGDCPTCGQRLPLDQLNTANDAFEKAKRRRLDEIEHSASVYRTAIEDAKEQEERLAGKLTELTSALACAQAELSAAEKNTVMISDMPEYAAQRDALTAQIAQVEEQVRQLRVSSADTVAALTAKLTQVKAELSAVSGELAKEVRLEMARKRIVYLREEVAKTEAVLERLERKLWLVEEFTRYKTRFVEDSINGLFRIVRFRLFYQQENGGICDCCDAVYDGVPYGSLNNGAKINVGIDIINTLSASYGVQVPLFVDNAESVTKLEYSGTQVIRLVVSEQDKELRCEYEN